MRHRGVQSYGDYRAAIDDPGVDAVVVAVPPRFHLDLTLQALASGKHVLVENRLRRRPESQKTPGFVGQPAAPTGPNGSENGWPNPKQLAVRLAVPSARLRICSSPRRTITASPSPTATALYRLVHTVIKLPSSPFPAPARHAARPSPRADLDQDALPLRPSTLPFPRVTVTMTRSESPLRHPQRPDDDGFPRTVAPSPSWPAPTTSTLPVNTSRCPSTPAYLPAATSGTLRVLHAPPPAVLDAKLHPFAHADFASEEETALTTPPTMPTGSDPVASYSRLM